MPAFRLTLAASACLCVGTALAMDLRPDAVFGMVGAASHGVATASAGLAWDWDFERMRRKAFLTASTEVFLSRWQARDFGGGHQAFQQVVVLPLLRMQLDQGRSPWFLEVGVGASWLNRLYVTPFKQTSTKWNFYDVLGAGYRFGARQEHEIGLRYAHVSNAQLREPNPGEDFLQLRYAVRF